MSIRKKLWSKLIALVLAVTLAMPSVYIPARAEEIAVYETTDENVEERTEVPPEEESLGNEVVDDAVTDEAVTEKTDSAENAAEDETSHDSEADEATAENIESDDAESVEEKSEDSEESADSSVETAEEDYTILSEVEEKRDEESKTFLLDDGSFMVAQYGVPVHYEDENGKWQDIDTSLAEETADAEDADGTYATTEKSGKKEKISFSKKLKEGKTIKIKGSDYTLSWGLVGAEKQSAVVETKESEEKLTGNNKFLAQTDLSQKVVYRDIFEGVDAEYILYSEGIKENIILKEKGAQGEFEILYNIDKLTAVQEDAQTINLMNGEEIIYQIQAPYMVDAQGEMSGDVFFSIVEEKNKKLTVKLTADEAWLASEERVYPVTIDPSVTTKQTKSVIKTTFVASDNASTEFYTKSELLVGYESSDYGVCRTLVKINLPKLSASDIVVDAKLGLITDGYQNDFFDPDGTPDLQINAHQITGAWNIETVNWNNKPGFDSEILDYAYITQDMGYIQKVFDITSAAKAWYEGTTENNGIMIKAGQEVKSSADYPNLGVKAYFWPERYNSATDLYPIIQITYRNNKGLEDYWTYTTVSAGTAGTAYINDYTGNLVFVHEDISTTGLLLPATLQHVFNGYMQGTQFSSSHPKSGKGWKLNLQQTLVETTQAKHGLDAEAQEVYPYAYEDGDGTVHFFYAKDEDGGTKYYDEDGLGLELTISGSTKTITDKKDNTMTFGAKGNLTSIGDAYGNKIAISYEIVTDGTNRITKITDGAGHVITLEKDSYNRVSKITDPSGRITTYSYSSVGNLTRITYPDESYSLYSYDADGALIRAVSSDGSGLAFTYTTAETGKRVSKVEEFGNDSTRNSDGTIKAIGTLGQAMTFDRTKYNTTVIRTSGLDDLFETDDDILTTYQFDDFGRTISTSSKTADGVYYGGDVYTYTAGAVNSTGSNIQKLNRVADSAYSGKNQRNYLKNHSGETTGNWSKDVWIRTSGEYEGQRSTAESYFGSYSYQITGTSATKDGGYQYAQDLDASVLVPGKTYTYSAYVKTDKVKNALEEGSVYGACLALKFTLSEGDAIRKYSELLTGTTEEDFNNGWKRIFVTFTVPETATSTRVSLVLRNATGSAYFDGMQIEYGSSMNAYNMFENAGFEEVTDGKPDNWEYINIGAGDGASTVRYFAGSTSMKITGEASKYKYIYQQVPVSGTEKDIYVVSAWARADAVKDTAGGSRPFDIYAKIYYSDNTSVVKTKKAEFNRDVQGWQRVSMAFDLDDEDDDVKRTPTKISIRLRYNYQVNTAYFDQAQLVKDVAGSYTYDSEGNLITAEQNGDQSTAYTYDSNSDLTEVINAENTAYEYTYNDAHQITEATTKTKGSKGVVYSFYYNSKGPLYRTDIKNSDGSKILRSGKYFTSAADGVLAHAYVWKDLDENGYETVYDYDLRSGNVLSVTTPDEVKTSYTYNEKSNVLEKIASGETSVSYGYDTTNTKLLSIDHNGFQYSFVYDIFGNVTSTRVADQILSTNEYAANNGKLKQITYGNGQTKAYTYNKAGSVVAEKINGTKLHSWTYDSAQTPIAYEDHESGQKHTYEYDITGRLIGTTVSDTQAEEEQVVVTSRYSYNKLNQLKKEEVTAGGRTSTVTNTYDVDSRLTKSAFSSTRGITYSYDDLGRLNAKTLTTGTPVQINYLYWNSKRNGDSTTKLYKTTQVARELIGNVAYRYTYDKMGNIIQIEEGTRTEGTPTGLTDPVVKITYQYDSKNQLIREDNKYLDKIILYSYDNGGNLLTKQEYDYTEDGSLVNPKEPVVYEYDETWKDQLVSYNGDLIEYDEIGNPVTYLGKTLTWQGRSLKTLKGENLDVSYKYNADGLRTEKVNGEETSEYYYAGGQLVYEKRGDKELYYSYDANGALGRINYYKNGSQVGAYYVATTVRGDVEAIYNTSGELRAKYQYDSWGNVISVTDGNGNAISETDKDHIGHVNPFRYRGYYYDAETGFYYVSSRYYDPEVGRFISADGEISGVGGDIRGYNLYSYCFNNPVNMFDPTGNWPRWISATVAAVATVVAVVTAAPAAIAVAAVAACTYVAQTIHYDVRQSKNTNLPKTPKEADDAGWRNSNPKTSSNPNGGGPAASCHQNTSKNKTNVKYVSPDGKREVIFDSAGIVVNDPRDIGTYNFQPSRGAWYSEASIKHFGADILPWIFLGNADEDWGPVINLFIN